MTTSPSAPTSSRLPYAVFVLSTSSPRLGGRGLGAATTALNRQFTETSSLVPTSSHLVPGRTSSTSSPRPPLYKGTRGRGEEAPTALIRGEAPRGVKYQTLDHPHVKAEWITGNDFICLRSLHLDDSTTVHGGTP